MELRRAPNASTFVSFPMISTAGATLSGLTLTGRWVAWSDTSGPNAQGNPKYRTLTGSFVEISATGTYSGALASTELPVASPYVLLVFENTSAATQYLLVRTSTKLDLTAAADNTIEKAMARLYMVATNYLDAAISSRATPAQVSTQVAAELATTTYAEPAQGTPPATTDLRSKIGYLYKAWRNRTTQTATLYRVYNDDAATADHKASFSDDGTTADRGEVATGP